MADVRYFSTINGEAVRLEPVGYWDEKTASIYAVKASETGLRKKDCNAYAVGRIDGAYYFADRVIVRKAQPSNHKCGAKCRHAKGGQCECECGGKYHGAGN